MSAAKEAEKRLQEYFNKQIVDDSLRKVAYAMGAYCLFREKYAFINLLFTYNQPDDADGKWGNSDVFPSKLEYAVLSYYKYGISKIENQFFFEDHHGSEKYYKMIYILTVIHALMKQCGVGKGCDVVIKDFKLSVCDPQIAQILTSSIDSLKKLSNELIEDKIGSITF